MKEMPTVSWAPGARRSLTVSSVPVCSATCSASATMVASRASSPSNRSCWAICGASSVVLMTSTARSHGVGSSIAERQEKG